MTVKEPLFLSPNISLFENVTLWIHVDFITCVAANFYPTFTIYLFLATNLTSFILFMRTGNSVSTMIQ